MNMIARTTGLAALLTLGAMVAAAPASAEGGYIASGGVSLLYDDADEAFSNGLEDAERNGVGAFGSIGYRWDNAFATELEGGLRGGQAIGAAEESTGRGASQDTKVLMMNARITPDTGGPLRPYAGIGAGMALVNTQDHGLGSNSDNISPAGQAMAGFSLDMSTRTSFFAEYRYMKVLTSSSSSTTGRSDSHAGFVGLRVRFGDFTR